MEQTKQWYYRGSLKSCNYSCSYCPFCKRRSSSPAIEKDKQQFFRFIEKIETIIKDHNAVQVVPYGEALIHPYYWEGLARLSKHPGIDAVGAQSNFSFPVKKMLSHYIHCGGKIEKLRLWGTFHPEMTSLDDFIAQCNALTTQNVMYCVGAVGVPSQIPDIQKLRKKLSPSVYLWINKMDGLGRNYTPEEVQQFLEIDPYFDSELRHYKAGDTSCGNQIFVDGDGSLRKCNLCKPNGNFYDEQMKEPICNVKECSCYLAYNNRREQEHLFFAPYPAFRIPSYPKAVFLDVDGTLVPKGEKRIPEKVKHQILKLSEHSALYLATSLPLEDALHKITGIHQVLSGGVFASGGRCTIFKKRKAAGGEYLPHLSMDTVFPMETDWLGNIEALSTKYGFRTHIYQSGKDVYKVTLSFPSKKIQRLKIRDSFFEKIVLELGIPKSCRYFFEENCIEIIRQDRGKLEGILEIMEKMRYSKDEIFVAGDGKEDAAMIAYFPLAVRTDSEYPKKEKS